MKPPKATSGSSQSVHAIALAMPITTAAAIETAASAHSTPSGIFVWSGRPLSSSRACAPTPIASAKAAIVAPSRAHENVGASAAPIAAYERCQSVYGGCRSVR